MSRPDVAVVVATYQRAERLARLVRALEAQTFDAGRFEVVIVDNGSTDATAEVLARLVATSSLTLRTLRIDVNDGPVPARNAGWRATTAPWVAFTDDDCVPSPDWLAEGLAVATADTAGTPSTTDRSPIGIVQGRTLPATEPVKVWSATRRVEALSWLFEGCNLFVHRDALDASGGFDDRFWFYGEDTSMGWSVLEAGYRAAFAPDAVVHHDVTRPPFRARLRERAMEGNLVRVARLHPGFRTTACWRPWAYRHEDVLHLAGVTSLAAAAVTRRPALALGALPWLVDRWPPGRVSRAGLVHVGKRWIDDTVGVTAMVRASVRERTVLL